MLICIDLANQLAEAIIITFLNNKLKLIPMQSSMYSRIHLLPNHDHGPKLQQISLIFNVDLRLTLKNILAFLEIWTCTPGKHR